MGTQVYRLQSGVVVPSVTTVIDASLGWNKGALMWWAYSQGKEGKDFRQAKQDAADAGTLAHTWAEEHDKALPLAPVPIGFDTEMTKRASSGIEAYREWLSRNDVRMIHIEKAMVSEVHGFGGTLDRLIEFNGKLAILDIKTSKATYSNHVIQIAAYARLVKETLELDIDRLEVIRFGREGDFHHSSYKTESFEPGWRAFKCLLELYHLKKQVEKLV